MDILKQEIERKKRLLEEKKLLQPAKKYFKRSELVKIEKEEYFEKYGNCDKNSSDENKVTSVNSKSEDDMIDHSTLPRKEVIKRLRERGEPILLFSETELEAFKRLRKYEMLEPEINKIKLSDAGDKLIIFYFWAPWCRTCKLAAPKLDELEKIYPDIILLKIDVDEAIDLYNTFHVDILPTFIFMKKTIILSELYGFDFTKVVELTKKYYKFDVSSIKDKSKTFPINNKENKANRNISQKDIFNKVKSNNIFDKEVSKEVQGKTSSESEILEVLNDNKNKKSEVKKIERSKSVVDSSKSMISFNNPGSSKALQSVTSSNANKSLLPNKPDSTKLTAPSKTEKDRNNFRKSTK